MRLFVMALLLPATHSSRDVGWPQQKVRAVALLDTPSRYKTTNEDRGFILGISFPSFIACSTTLSWSNNSTVDHLWQFPSVGGCYNMLPQHLISSFL